MSKMSADNLVKRIIGCGLDRPDVRYLWRRTPLLIAMYQCGFQDWLFDNVRTFKDLKVTNDVNGTACGIRPLHHAGFVDEAKRATEELKSKRIVINAATQTANVSLMKGWVFVDSIYLITAVLPFVGEEKIAHEEVKAMYHLMRNENGVLRHIKNFTEAPPEERDEDVPEGYHEGAFNWIDATAWGRGNGWFVAGVVDILEASRQEDAAVREIFIDVCKSLLKYQEPSGMWKATIDDSYAYPESSGTVMIAYAFLKGFKLGLLSEEYRRSAFKALGELMGQHFDWETFALKDQQYGPLIFNVPTPKYFESGCTYGQGFLAMLLNLATG